MACDCELRRQTKVLKEINKTLQAIFHTLSSAEEGKELAEKLRASTDELEAAVSKQQTEEGE